MANKKQSPADYELRDFLIAVDHDLYQMTNELETLKDLNEAGDKLVEKITFHLSEARRLLHGINKKKISV